MSARRWVFTLNNYTDAHEATLKALECKYLVYGKEIAPTTLTPHLQGFIKFPKVYRLAALKKIERTIHWEPAKGSDEQASAYCKKDGLFHEQGSMDDNKGKRSDLDDFKDAVKAGILDRKELRDQFSEVCAKYPRFVTEYIRDQIPDPEVEAFPLFQWQQDLYDYLKLPPDDRQIVFIVDKKGNSGKTWFARYYSQLHKNAQLMEPAKKADMAYALQDDLRVLFVNVTRQQQEHFQYSFFESLKDGHVFSPKYESMTRKFNKVHIVVLMNQAPNMELLSEDRYKIVELRDGSALDPF